MNGARIAVVALAATLGVACWTAAPTARGAASSAVPGAGPAPARPVAVTAVAGAQPVDLDAEYYACALAAGFDPGGVQVLRWSGTEGPAGAGLPAPGTPYWVKTGRDVPAAVHGPCLARIGGTDPHRSSHGL